jgi:hypothetical protein
MDVKEIGFKDGRTQIRIYPIWQTYEFAALNLRIVFQLVL